MPSESSLHVQLRMAARPENVAVVRAMLAGAVEALGLTVETADCMRTAVSEVCNNVVMHAYPGDEGPMEVALIVRREEVEVRVSDSGTGILPHPANAGMQGVGLAVVQAFTDYVELRGSPGEGTRVRMHFRRRVPGPASGLHDVLADELEADLEAPPAGVLAALAPTPLAGPVLAQMTAQLAVRAHFSTDRIADAQLLTDAIAAQTSMSASAGRLVIAIDVEPRTLHVTVGPLGPAEAGAAQESGVSALETVVARLTDDVELRERDGAEVVVVRISDERRPVRRV